MTIIKIRFLTLAVLLLLVASCGGATTTTEKTKPTTTTGVADADNTARNDRDRNAAAQTPVDQGQNARDLEISANIRKAIVADDSLSSNAHNVKIITSDGMVALRGPVKTEKEKTTIETKAKEIAGSTRVQSFLEVETKP
jgi:hyperosmotically inducible periplasmic protein